ncbi:MAG: M48 family metallopeptidase [Candidatus Cloacimonetes bacterium]|nr:M48 family metallopeptidase [Candidatus Cloacimonadota bacterium]
MIRTIGGITFELVKKNIKTGRIQIKPPDGKVIFHVPYTWNEESIEKGIIAKTPWILEKIALIQALPPVSPTEYNEGDIMYVWGKPYSLHIELNKNVDIQLVDEQVVLSLPRLYSVSMREAVIYEWYRILLAKEINKLLPKWEGVTKLKTNSWVIKKVKSKWGSCSPSKSRIIFSLYLAKKPIECLEFIILHELLHFKEIKHNKDFYALMDKYMPNWRIFNKLLEER